MGNFAVKALTEVSGELWRRGDLSWLLRPHQRRMYSDIRRHFDSERPLYALLVSRRFGKTTVLLLIAIEECLRHKNHIVRFVAPYLKDAREIAHETIAPLLEPAPYGEKPVWNLMDSYYSFSNNSKIHIAGSNSGHEDDSRGRRADLCIVDEAAFGDRLLYTIYSVLMPQLLESGRIGKIIISSTPSDSPSHPFQALCADAANDGRLSKHTVDDNTYLTQEIRDQIVFDCGGRKSTVFRREYMAEFVVEETRAVIPEWASASEECTLEVPRDELYHHYDKWVFMDFGVVSYTVILYAYYHFKLGKIVVERENYVRGHDARSDTIAGMIRGSESELWGSQKPYARIGDNSDPILLNDLNTKHGIYVRPTNKSSLHSMVDNVRLWVKAKRIVVHPSCTMLIGCLSTGIWDLRREKFEMSEAYGHMDALAALIYGVRNMDESRNPIPAGLGITPQNMWINEEELERKSLLRKKLDKMTKQEYGVI